MIRKKNEFLVFVCIVFSLEKNSVRSDFLSEALYLSQVNKEAYFEVNFQNLSDKFLDAKIKGREVLRFGEDIKAVTYHDLEVKKIESNWRTIVLFDI